MVQEEPNVHTHTHTQKRFGVDDGSVDDEKKYSNFELDRPECACATQHTNQEWNVGRSMGLCASVYRVLAQKLVYSSSPLISISFIVLVVVVIAVESSSSEVTTNALDLIPEMIPKLHEGTEGMPSSCRTSATLIQRFRNDVAAVTFSQLCVIKKTRAT